MPAFGDGGVERMLVNLAAGLDARGVKVDFLVASRQAPYLDRLPPGVTLIQLDRGLRLLPSLIRYLRARQPSHVLTSKDDAARTALRARWLSGERFKLLIRVGTHIPQSVASRSPLKRWRTLRQVRFLFPRADAVIANSRGVAAGIEGLFRGIQPWVIRNPTVTPELQRHAAEALSHPWFGPGQPPVILGIGRLVRAKGFDTLIRAFARVRGQRPCRLLILGKGHLLPELGALGERLSVGEDVAFPGFVNNPYAYLARSALFVLSSRWEGAPNALVEALALGTPSVATDCLSGPREILQNGRYGPLVPVDDVEALAAAMLATLDHPLPAATLREAAADYTLAASAQHYHELLESLS